MFAGEPRTDIEDSFNNVCIILTDIALSSPQAQLYYNILVSFAEAVAKYRQRVAAEMHYTVQHYMDRILVIEPAEAHIDQHQNNSTRDTEKPCADYMPSNINSHADSDPRTLFQMPPFEDQHDDWVGGDIPFSEYLVPELEPFDQLFYTVE